MKEKVTNSRISTSAIKRNYSVNPYNWLKEAYKEGVKKEGWECSDDKFYDILATATLFMMAGFLGSSVLFITKWYLVFNPGYVGDFSWIDTLSKYLKFNIITFLISDEWLKMLGNRYLKKRI